MAFTTRFKTLTGATFCSFALMVFSLFIRTPFPLKLISFPGLILAAVYFGYHLRTIDDLRKISGEFQGIAELFLFCTAGAVTGILMAMYYRNYMGIGIFPKSFHLFIIIAALTGAVEELVFRGFLQEQVRIINGSFSVLFSTLSHTGYKCCLFILPASGINIPVLFFFTFSGGLLFGIMRHFSRSIIPSLIAHILFDILVYAEFVKAPWWVW